uniref:(northern house mosquito) hypothetical protein n=1 Tax=Culex pipiens TaxID=7175 RepID=A0A8D8N736_CULPI
MAICRVKGCKSTRSNPNVTLHKFPKDPNVRDKWLKFCGCADGQNLFVCFLHFRENDYEHIFMQNAKKNLQKSAVPSIRVPAVESARDNRVSCRNRKKLVVELLEADAIRSKEAADYQKLIHEVYEPLSPFDWFPSVSVTDPAIVRPESVGVTSASRSPAVDVSLPVPAIEQPESVFLTSGCRSPADDAAIVRPESVGLTSGCLNLTSYHPANLSEDLSMMEPLDDSCLTSSTYEAMDTSGLQLLCDAISFTDLTANTSEQLPREKLSGYVPVKRGTVQKIKLQNYNHRRTIHNLRAELKERDKLIRSLRRESERKSKDLELLRTQIADCSASHEQLIRIEVYKAFGKIFTKNQIDLILELKKKVKWTDEEIKLAFALRYHSQPAYEMVRKELKIPLPCLRRLREFASGINMRGGVLFDVLSEKKSREKIRTQQEPEKN